jgi:starch-binding outer membrane protein, SusD/RagB family
MIRNVKHSIKSTGKLIFLLLPGLLASCSDWLQLEPESELTREEYWRTGNDVEAVVAGGYKELANSVTTCFKWGELRSDDFVPGNHIGTMDKNLMDGNIYPVNDNAKWSSFYRIINYSNTILKFSPLVLSRDRTFTQNEQKAYDAEALFLRSLSYFYLLRTFGDVPLVLEASLSDNQNFYPGISSRQQIVSQITQDLITALPNLPSSYGRIEYDKGRATKQAVLALLADIYLYSGKYAEAVDACDKLIVSGQYALIPSEDWFLNFFPGNSNESIFEVQFDKDQNQLNQLYMITAPYPEDGTYPDGDDQFRFSPYMVDLFKKNDGDRRAGNKTYFEFDSRSHFYILWKYVGTSSSEYAMTPRNGNAESDANWIIYRFADILLMKAEASVQLNDLTSAIDLVNQVRKRAGITLLPDISNRGLLLDAVFEERAREFAGEGKRWFDLVRLGMSNNYEYKDKFISIITANKPLTEKEILISKYSDPNSWYLPIHQDEIEQNRNLMQNPYYVNQ